MTSISRKGAAQTDRVEKIAQGKIQKTKGSCFVHVYNRTQTSLHGTEL